MLLVGILQSQVNPGFMHRTHLEKKKRGKENVEENSNPMNEEESAILQGNTNYM